MSKATDGEPANNGAGSMDGISGDDAGPIGEADDGQLFVVENETTVTLSQLYRRGTPVEHRITLGSKSIPSREGLISFQDPDLVLVVPGRAGDVKISPTYNPDGTVKKVTIYASIKPLDVIDARSERGREALAGGPVTA